MSHPNIQNPPPPTKAAKVAEWLKPAGTALGVLLLLAGLNLLWHGITSTHLDQNDANFKTYGLNYSWHMYFAGFKAHRDFIMGATLLGGAVGLITVAWGLFDSGRKPPMKLELFYGIGAVAAVFIVLFILHYGMHQIGGFDQSHLVDASWRLIQGQKAYVDFPYTMPISYFLGGKFAFQWFGAYWRSFVDIMALFAVLTFAWSLFLLAQLFGRSWTTLLWATAMQIFSPMMASYITYNPITAMAAVLYTLSATYWLRRPSEKAAMASYGVALLLMATMKPNVAGILIPGISVILFFSPAHRWKVVGVSFSAFILFCIFLWINHLTLSGMLAGYLSVAQRGASLEPFLIDLDPLEKSMAMLMLLSILVPAVLALSLRSKTQRSLVAWIPAIAMFIGYLIFVANHQNKPVGEATIFVPVAMALIMGRKNLRSISVWIPTFVLLAGLYGFITNSEQKLVDMPPVLCAAILLAAELRSLAFSGEGQVFQMPIWWNRYLALACVVLSATGLAQGVARDRTQSIGPVQFFEWDDSRHVIADGVFKGVHCGDVLNEVVNEETEVLRREPSSNVWFGPRMQWGYANFKFQSPSNEPIIWDGGRTMYAKSKEEYYFNNFLQHRHPLLILFKNDVTFLSQDEVQRMAQQYEVDQSFPVLTVLHLKK